LLDRVLFALKITEDNMSRLKTGMAIIGLGLGLLFVQCSKKIGPDEPELFPDLHIVKVLPENGQANVPESITFSATFSEALDTTFNAPVGLIIAPTPEGFYSGLQLSADRKSILSSVKLAPNTVYSVVIFFALDRFRDRIRQPFVTRFATAPAFPGAEVAGKTEAPFNVPLQGFAGLVSRNPQNIVSSDTPDLVLQQILTAVSTIDNNAGDYRIKNVPPGTYWPIAGKDQNGDGRFSLASGDQVQTYDANNDEAPDSIVVSADQKISAVDLKLLLVGMKVLRTVPVDGATNIPLSTNFEIAFSAAVDTANLGLFIAPIPEGLSTRDLVLSGDGKTLTAAVTLQPSTAYTAVLYAARSKSGQTISSPVQISFTTGNSFPTGEIGGTAILRGATGTTQNALVGLLNKDLQQVITEIFTGKDPTEVLRNSLKAISYVRDASGNFVIPHVPAGTYWPAGALDVDSDGSIEPLTEPIGFYDADNDGSATRADSIALAEGEKRSGVTIIFQRFGQ
jgi:hypothetical protein